MTSPAPAYGGRALALIIHGESGVGKTTLADTAPAPRLLIDAEGGSRFTASRKIGWDGLGQPPLYDGTWDTCVVIARNFKQVSTIYAWLNSGQHHFKSVIMDSLTEVQKRCMDDVAGIDQPTTQHWGALLRQMEGLIRSFRDLRDHPTNPLEMIVFVCPTKEISGRFRPFVQGSLQITLPFFVDVVGFLYVAVDAQSIVSHNLLVQPTGQHDAKDRTGRLGYAIAEPNLVTMLDTVYGPVNADAA